MHSKNGENSERTSEVNRHYNNISPTYLTKDFLNDKVEFLTDSKRLKKAKKITNFTIEFT